MNNPFNETQQQLVANQCSITVNSNFNSNYNFGDKTTSTPEASTIVNNNNTANREKSALKMSQLGTVYATKRRRRNGKRLVMFILII